MTVRSLLIPLALSILCGAGPPTGWCAVQETAQNGVAAGENASGPLWFVRVHVPADRLTEKGWRDSSVQYLPVDRQEFERLVAVAQKAGRADQAASAPAVTSALYQARLDGEALADGEAWLDVVHAAEGARILSLDPCGLAISEVTWTGAEGQSAKVGLGTDGKLAVLVERPGRLHFRWSLRGSRDDRGILSFAWESPASPASSLVLDLPESLTPEADRAIVRPEKPEEEGMRRWRLDSGGQHRFAIRLVPADGSPGRLPSTRVRQSTDYYLSLRGVEIESRLELDVLGDPLRQVTLRLDPGLRLVKAQYGETLLRWSPAAPAADEQDPRVVLELPEPVQGVKRWVRVWALAPIQLGSRFRLPAIRPEGMSWEEGVATLSVPAPLRLEELVPDQARQSSKIDPLPSPNSGETVELRYFNVDGSAEVTLSRPETPLRVDSASLIELGGGEITSHFGAEVCVEQDKRFQLEADLARQWTVDSVETVPGEALVDWRVEKEGPRSKLTIQLANAVPQRLPDTPPLGVLILARRVQPPLGRAFGLGELVPLRFREAAGGRRLVCLYAGEPYELKLTGAESLTRVDPRSLDATPLALVPDLPRGPVYEDNAAASRLRVSLEARKPGYSGTIGVEAVVSEDSLTESYLLSCVPEAGRRVDRVLARFSPARKSPLVWTLGGESEEHWTAQRLPPPESTAPSETPPAETWEIRLRPPRSVPFEIRATRTTPLSAKEPVSLASLPEAGAQRGTVVVGTVGSAAVRIENGGLKPVPATTVFGDSGNAVRAAFGYDPDRDTAGGAEPALGIARLKPDDAPPPAWAWSCQLESQYEPSGTGRHVATYRLETARAERLRLTLPPGVTRQDVRGVWVDDEQATCRSGGDEAGSTLEIDLPRGRRFPVVSLCFATAGRPLAVIGAIAPPLPEPDVPVIARHWTAWLPPGYEARDADFQSQARRPPPLSWQQRLFGLLGREPGRSPFDPLSPEDWQRAAGGDPVRQSAEEAAGAVIDRLGERAAQDLSGPATEALDWGTLLADPSMERRLAGLGGDQPRLDLLIDRPALARLGLGPRTPVRLPRGDQAAARGATLLGRADLALLAHPGAIVVTSETAAAAYRAQLAPAESRKLTSLENERVWWIRPGSLFDQVERAAAGDADRSLVPARAWAREPAASKMPWRLPQPSGFEPGSARGWTAYQLEISDGAPARLSLVRRDTLEVFRWAAFLAMIGLGWWKAIRRPRTLTAVLGILGIAALVLPEVCAPAASGAVLGTLFVLGLSLIRAPRPAADRSNPPSGGARTQSSGSATVRAGVFVLAVGVWVAASAPVRGAEPGPEPLPAWWPAQGVLIPVDENQKPTGDTYYVPEQFDKLLRRIAGARTVEAQGWLIAGATYRGALAWQPAPERLVLSELKASVEIEVLSAPARVGIPFGAQGPSLVPDTLMLDGRPVKHELQQSTLAFTVPEKGRHRLDVTLKPTMLPEGGLSGFDLAIPRLATSRLELTIPADAPTVDVRSAGQVWRDQTADPPRIEAQLGPTDLLSARWPGGTGPTAGGDVVDVEELLWLKVKPKSVVLDARFLVNAGEGRVRELRLAVDPRLRLRPIEGAEILSPGGPTGTIRLGFSEPLSGQKVIAATFLLPEASGIGSLRLPLVKVLDGRHKRRWMAVWVDPSLKAEEHAQEPLEKIGLPDFLTAWGDTTLQPRSAYSLPVDVPSWSIATRPDDPTTTVDQTAAWGFTSEEARLRFDARLATTSGYRFQYRLRAPADFEVESVSLLEGDAERADRWRRAPDGTVTVFAKRAVSGEQSLSLRGRLPSPVRGDFSLPILRLEGAELKSSVIQLFRAPDVQVEVSEATGLTQAEAPVVDESRASLGRLVSCYQADPAQPVKATLKLSPNRPAVQAEQVTVLRSDGEHWEAAFEFRLRVKNGLLDELGLNVPDACPGPYQINPPPASLDEEETAAGRRLVIRPITPISGEHRFTVLSPLAVAPGERVRVPQVTLDQGHTDKHLVVVPTQSGNQPLVWETEGLSRAELPDGFSHPLAVPKASVVYQAEGGPFQASARPFSGDPKVPSADVRIAWQADGTYHGLAIFDLQWVRTPGHTLRLPPGCQLVEVSADSTASTPVRTGDAQWRILLAPSEFPQRVEVLFRGEVPLPGAGGLVQFEAPALEGLSPEQILWTVSGPPAYDSGKPEGLRSVSPAELDLARLQNLESLEGQAATVIPKEAKQIGRWLGVWVRRWAALCARTTRQQPPGGRADPLTAAATTSLPLDRLPQPVAAWLGRGDALAGLLPGASEATDPDQLWVQTLDRTEPGTACLGGGEATSITLRYRRVGVQGLSGRMLGAAGLAGLVLALVFGMHRGLVGAVFSRWPCALGVVVGLGWWLWLWPSVLGWAIVLLSLAASFRWGWKRPRQPGSAIVPLTLTQN